MIFKNNIPVTKQPEEFLDEYIFLCRQFGLSFAWDYDGMRLTGFHPEDEFVAQKFTLDKHNSTLGGFYINCGILTEEDRLLNETEESDS